MQLIISFVSKMLPSMLCVLPVAVIARIIGAHRMRIKGMKTTPLHEAALLCFVAFIAGLASITFVPQIEFYNGIHLVNAGHGEISLVPFTIFSDVYNETVLCRNLNYFLVNFVGNIAVFLPIGFFPPLLSNNMTLGKCVTIGFLSSLFIELCQLFLPRSTDVDDLWLNTLGCLLGFLLYTAFSRLAPNTVEKFKVKKLSGND